MCLVCILRLLIVVLLLGVCESFVVIFLFVRVVVVMDFGVSFVSVVFCFGVVGVLMCWYVEVLNFCFSLV